MLDKGNVRYPPTETAWLRFRRDRLGLIHEEAQRGALKGGFAMNTPNAWLRHSMGLFWHGSNNTAASAWFDQQARMQDRNDAASCGVLDDMGQVLETAAMLLYSEEKRIFRPDSLLIETMAGLRIKNDFPMQVFRKQDPCVYAIEFPQRCGVGVFNLRNFMVLKFDVEFENQEAGPRAMAILADYGEVVGYRPIVVLDLEGRFTLPWTVSYGRRDVPVFTASSAMAALEQADRDAQEEASAMAAAMHGPTGDLIHLILNLLLYLDGESDLTTIVRGARKNLSKKSPQEAMRLRELQEPHVFGFGAKWGRAVQHWIKEYQEQRVGLGGGVVCPHFRTAHRHLYWTGAGRTVPVVKYLLPILVNGDRLSPEEQCEMLDRAAEAEHLPTIHAVH